MKTIRDLGRRIKQQYPEYSDMSDEEVGRNVKEVYPGEYDDYVDDDSQEQGLAIPNSPLTPVLNSLRHVNLPTPSVKHHTNAHIQTVVDYYNPNRGRFTSWWQRGKSEARTRLSEVLTNEQLRVIEQGAVLEESYLKKQKTEIEFQLWVAQNSAALQQLIVNEQLINDALEKGRTLEIDQELIRAEGLSFIKTDEEDRLVSVRLREHVQRTRVDIENRWKEIAQDLDAADLAQMGEHQLLNKEREFLAHEVRGRHALLTGDDDQSVKDELVKDYDQHIDFLRKRIHARQTRLLLSEDGQEIRRLEATEADSGLDHSETAETDKE